MSGLAFPYLKEIAERSARAAVLADKKGDVEEALKNYKKAIEALEKIVKLYPYSPTTSAIIAVLESYKARVALLERKIVKASIEHESPGEPDEELPQEAQADSDSPLILKRITVAAKPNVTFDDIADLEKAKKALRESIIYPIKRPDLYPLGWPRGVLLFGPPGCGKTMLGAALANEVNGIFMYVDSSHIMSKWLGEAEKNVARVFEFAREKSRKGTPVIIFIDEIEALLGVYSSEVGGEARVRNQFLKEMDGMLEKGNSKLHVFVVGATNKPWKLDDAFIRRFGKRIYIPPPDRDTRAKLFELYTKHISLSEDVSFEKLAELTEGYSSSDIKDIVMEAYNRVISELFEKQGGTGKPRPVTMDDFLDVIRSRKSSLDLATLRRLERWAEDYEAV